VSKLIKVQQDKRSKGKKRRLVARRKYRRRRWREVMGKRKYRRRKKLLMIILNKNRLTISKSKVLKKKI